MEKIWFEERVISALNKTRPLEVVTTIGREGKVVSAVVGKPRDLELTPSSELKLGVESESVRAWPATGSMFCASYAGSISKSDISEGWWS